MAERFDEPLKGSPSLQATKICDKIRTRIIAITLEYCI